MRATLVKKVAAVTKPFADLLRRLIIAPAWRSPSFKGGKKWLTVKRIYDPRGEQGDYYFVERFGRDSIAFICEDHTRTDKPYLVLSQWHGPLRRFNVGTFTGSMDKEGLDPVEILQEELVEEAGLRIEISDLERRAQYLGLHAVSGNTNEQVHLFVVDIAGVSFSEKEPENIFEENLQMLWVDEKYILDFCEWKAQVALARHKLNKDYLTITPSK